ncbi:AbfB domain-containing protein [Acetivibrio mesophilus]|uniref:Anti-sigma factor domain-containing protein n=1 Tax=Acetivibrio mesophilus TaxID=2487273 RepID=A0A4Q0I6P1_9FIRM|nr:AbfB domain-containing protein [Acetivibrio mesophilus]ODM24950.1 alpha-L-arabinofuranosidase [Clostridium sp. Bc-iso-3]RXE60053.1 anti-sigma factor domain-containing protein [Acetivibrio mesophilus]HHV28725.1 anti-sigma factor domain-containing protein [Clostridium sp.]
MKYQGVILKLTKNKAIVSTDDFQCYYIKRKPTIYVGKEIEFTKQEIIQKRTVLIKPALSVACFLFVITCLLNFAGIINLNNILYNPKVFAYISVDINPSLEIEIDGTGNVLKLVPLNEDAKVLVSKLEVTKTNVSMAIDKIINEVKKSNAISDTEKDCVLISSTLNSKERDHNEEFQREKEKLDIIIDSLKDSIQKSSNSSVYIVHADMEEREAARTEGMSTGRYVLYNTYKDLESDLSFEEVKEANVNELIKSILDDESGNETPEEIPIKTSSPASTSTPTTPAASAPTPSSTLQPTSSPTSALTASPKSTPTSAPTASPKSTPTPTPTLTPTAKIAYSQFMRFESSNYRGYFIRVKSFSACISSYVEPIEDSMFKIVPGLADPSCISFESKNYPGYYLKHENFEVILKKYEDTDLYKEDATFKVVPGLADENMISFQSFNYPSRYIRHRDFDIYIEEIENDLGKKDSTYIGIKAE